jgi:hypothetical protein
MPDEQRSMRFITFSSQPLRAGRSKGLSQAQKPIQTPNTPNRKPQEAGTQRDKNDCHAADQLISGPQRTYQQRR